MASYEFVTSWEFHAPIARVWNEIYQIENWPAWWKAVEAVEKVKSGDASGVGAIHRLTWRGVLPYRLGFDMTATRVEPYVRLEGSARGELSGTGIWSFTERHSMTLVRYEWKVETSQRWMQILRPVARPIFAWNHDVVMRWGVEGLTKRLAR